MLDRLRQGARGWVSKLLMGLLVVSFAIWGVSGQFAGYGAGTVAWVGDEEVTAQEFARAHDQLQRVAQQSGRPVEPQQVLQQLLLNAALDDEAGQYNLGISDDRVARQIAEDPTFHGQNGAFDRDLFVALLRNAGIDHNDYVRDLRQEAVRGQISSSIGAGFDVPQPMIEALYRFRNEERTISFFVVDETAVEGAGNPGEEALRLYFDASGERFRAPEYRKLGLLVLDPAAIADPDAVTAGELAAEYERRKASFSRPERRRIEQLRFDTGEAAEAALAGLQGGTDLAALAESRGTPAADLDQGLKTRAEFLDAAVAEAAFAAAPDTIVAVLEGALEPSLIRVTEIEPAAVTPLEEVTPRLRQELAGRTARERMQDLYDQIEDERAGGATLQEIATSMSLPYRLVDGIAADGTAPDGSTLADLPAQDQLIAEAFDSDVGVENNPLRTPDDTFVFYEVLEIVPERDRTLEEARAEVVAAWAMDEISSRVSEKADALLSRLRQGEAMETLAAGIGKQVQTVENVKRGPTPPGLSANAAAQAFAGPQGHVANAEADTPPARILLKVDRVTAPAYFAEAADAGAIREQLAQGLRNDMLQSYNRQLLQARETQVNQATFQQLTGQIQAP